MKHWVACLCLLMLSYSFLAAASDKGLAETKGQPLYFSYPNDVVSVGKPQIEYDLKKSKGKSLSLNSLIFDSQTLEAVLGTEDLLVKWNVDFIPSGKLAALNKQGDELWSEQVDSSGVWKVLTSDSRLEQTLKNPFRLCLRSEKDRGYTSLCSSWYKVQTNKSANNLIVVDPLPTGRIIIQNEDRPLAGKVELEDRDLVQFFATLKSGASYEYITHPITPILKDVATSEESGKVIIIVEGAKPLFVDAKEIKDTPYNLQRKYLVEEKKEHTLWQIELERNHLKLAFGGEAGGVFYYPILMSSKDLPGFEDRLYLPERYLVGSYSQNDSILIHDSKSNNVKWEFDGLQRYQSTRVFYTPFNESHQVYLDVYRGSPRDLNLKLTGLITGGGDRVPVAEVGLKWWFEDILNSENYYLSRFRWGVNVHYFASLHDVEVSDDSGVVEALSLNVMQVDLRYRLSPGLWGRDETVGLIAFYNSATIGELVMPTQGVGLFWSRPLPELLERWISRISFLSSSSTWMNLEISKSLVSMDSNYDLRDSYDAHIEGRLYLNPRFYTELSFGAKKYNFVRNDDGAGANLFTSYGSLGAGFEF